jgi:hypothetical protein
MFNILMKIPFSEGIIMKGIKGEVIKKWGMRFFSPDIDQEGIELFTPPEQPYIPVQNGKIKIITRSLAELKHQTTVNVVFFLLWYTDDLIEKSIKRLIEKG